MDVTLAGLEVYTDDVWGKLPTDANAFTHNNGTPVDEESCRRSGRSKIRCRMVHKTIDTKIPRKIFARNKVNDRLGLYVNHRHFELQQGERLVEYGIIQTPWQLRTATADVKACITPKTWAFHGDSLVPTEFKFSPDDQASQHVRVPTEFIRELRGYLDAHDLTTRLGISTFPDGDFDPRSVFEMTVGRVSMLVPNSKFPDDEVVHVGWFFDENGAKVARDCYRCDWHTM